MTTAKQTPEDGTAVPAVGIPLDRRVRAHDPGTDGQWVAFAERKPADLTMCAFVTPDGKLRVGGYSVACGGFREAESDSGTWGAIYWLLLPPVRMPDGWKRSNVNSQTPPVR